MMRIPEIRKMNKGKAHHHSLMLMGCHFVITAIDHCPQTAWDAIRAATCEIERMEELISSWKPGSETSRINAHAGIGPVRISEELWGLIDRSLKISHLTTGAFDISGNLSRYYWDFNGSASRLPTEDKIKKLRDLIDYRLIEIDEMKQTVFLRKRGMSIGFGGIGKGYAAFKACQVMKNFGIESGLINASGDIMCWGNPPDRSDWTINIPNPEKYEVALLEISIPSGSVVTSGHNFKYSMIDGKKYSHIVDPRTGMPIEADKCVSVVCPNPELGDALATALSVMEDEEGLALVNQLDGIECMIIRENSAIQFSNNLAA